MIFFFLKQKFNVDWGFIYLFILFILNEHKEILWTTSFLQSWHLKVNSIPLARKDLKSLKTCNQICFFILKNFKLSLQRQSKKWNVWDSHMLGTSKRGKNPKLEDWKFLRVRKFCSLESHFLVEANKGSVWSLEKKK